MIYPVSSGTFITITNIKKRALEHWESWALSAHLYHLGTLLKSTVVPYMTIFLLGRLAFWNTGFWNGLLPAEVTNKLISCFYVLSAWQCDSLARCCSTIASVKDAVCLFRWLSFYLKKMRFPKMVIFLNFFFHYLYTMTVALSLMIKNNITLPMVKNRSINSEVAVAFLTHGFCCILRHKRRHSFFCMHQCQYANKI